MLQPCPARHTLAYPLLFSLVASVPVSSANAQALEEITVTAQRREQSLQDVAISVSAFSGEQLDQLGYTDSVDVAALSPGVAISGSVGGSNAQFTIRGVTQNDFLETAEGPTAIYIDEGLVIQQNAGTFGMFDMERVEILKGPQGTLFGRNATGGLVHYITRKPTDDPEAYVDLTYGRFQQMNVQGAVSGPLADGVRARAAFFFNRHDSILNNVYDETDGPNQIRTAADLFGADFPDEVSQDFQEDKFNDDTIAGRLSFEIDLAENIQLYIMGQGSRRETSEAIYQSRPTISVYDGDPLAGGQIIDSLFVQPGETREAIGPGGVGVEEPFSLDADTTRPVPGGDLFGYIDEDGLDFNFSSDFSPNDNNIFEMYGVNINLDWTFGDYRFVSITDFKNFDRNGTVDIDAAPVDQLAFNTASDTTSLTQEFRLENTGPKLNWVTGFYYLYSDANANNGLIISPSSVVAPLFGATDAANEIFLETNSFSAFGQADYNVTETVTFTAGARIIQEEKDYSLNQSFFTNGDDPLALNTETVIAPLPNFIGDESGEPFVTSTSNTLWSAKLGVSWQPNDDVLLFATINRGIKAGNFNAPLPLFFPGGIPQEDIAYEPEKLWAYEIGAKTTILDGLAQFNASAFFYDYNDYQAFRFVGVSGVVENADATIFGGEAELRTNPFPGFDLFMGVSAMDAEVKDITVGGITRDRDPSFAPEFQWSGLARYAYALLGGEAAVQLDGRFRSRFYNNLTNFTSTKMAEAWTGNAQVSYRAPQGNWQVTAFVDNFMDARNEEIGFDVSSACGCSEIAISAPRWWGVRLRMEFF